MPSFRIEGGRPLQGTIRASGNKNAALPLMTACLMTEEPVVLHNVPEIGDVQTMRNLLQSLGVQIEAVSPGSWRLQASQVQEAHLDPDLCRRIRASILLAGPMLNRAGALRLPPPGGDVIGRRRVDTHFLALGALGAQVDFKNRQFQLRARKRMQGASMVLDEASVTASENAIMAAALAEGTTTIRNAASEPHVQELCHFL
ncbi:MAG TPA: UDP-N-acetylglucosamine 1-carboxyvinyltransferase, partial [Desulfurivibrionaceae bacterium]|nr:UDP-N-acetylglucosamine 1-carboxyvinyltransferase [Desulfurivibrionaceae bacterium]